LTDISEYQSTRDSAFFAALDIPILFELARAANYLHCQKLLEGCCAAVAGHMRGLSVEQLREKFNIINDFTADEEERLRDETARLLA
jgi:S-phase kinase-associated protein 1